MLYDDPVLVARHFQYKFELKEVIIDGPLRKKIILYVLNVDKKLVLIPIHLYEHSMHQILIKQLAILSLLRKQ